MQCLAVHKSGQSSVIPKSRFYDEPPIFFSLPVPLNVVSFSESQDSGKEAHGEDRPLLP